jgi:NAD-dependent dihydropyrimidine dehydrogenase PreA subunit
MTAIINFKICDNSSECSGINSCPNGAFRWNDKKKTIEIDNKKCTSCGTCEKACPVGAIRVAIDKAELKKIKKEISEDKRKISDLFVDRYGAQPIHDAFLEKEENVDKLLNISKIPIMIEFFNADSIRCLLYSIPIKELFSGQIRYNKIELKTDKLLKKYKIKKLPALLFFNNGKLVGKIEGYYERSQIKEIKNKINKIKKVA